MKYTQGRQGRVFVLRLEDKEVLHETLEQFAADHRIAAGVVWAVGAADEGSKLVVGPRDADASPVVPLERTLEGVHELVGVGTLFPDEDGRPILHMHVACGRRDGTTTGCVRRGVRTWKTLEVVIYEIIGAQAKREKDPVTGFELLNPRRPTVTDLSQMR